MRIQSLLFAEDFPNCPSPSKVHASVNAILEGNLSDGPCGIDAAAVHTRMINKVQKEFEIKNIRKSLLREEDELLYAEGLFERLTEVYKKPDVSISDYEEE